MSQIKNLSVQSLFSAAKLTGPLLARLTLNPNILVKHLQGDPTLVWRYTLYFCWKGPEYFVIERTLFSELQSHVNSPLVEIWYGWNQEQHQNSGFKEPLLDPLTMPVVFVLHDTRKLKHPLFFKNVTWFKSLKELRWWTFCPIPRFRVYRGFFLD